MGLVNENNIVKIGFLINFFMTFQKNKNKEYDKLQIDIDTAEIKCIANNFLQIDDRIDQLCTFALCTKANKAELIAKPKCKIKRRHTESM